MYCCGLKMLCLLMSDFQVSMSWTKRWILLCASVEMGPCCMPLLFSRYSCHMDGMHGYASYVFSLMWCLFYVLIYISYVSICFMCQYLFCVSVSVLCVSICSLCWYLFCVSVSVLCVSICSVCKYLFCVSVSVLCVGICSV